MTRKKIGITSLVLLFFLLVARPWRHHVLRAGSTSNLHPLVVAQSADMESLEPDALNSMSSVSIADLLWVRLLRVTPDGRIVPMLAERYEWNDAGTEITFHIRNDMRCQDGSPLTARDVVYTLNRAADPKFGFYGNLPAFIYSAVGFRGARLVDDWTATVSVRGYSSATAGMLAQAYIVCQKEYKTLSKDEATHKVFSTGPYKLVEWQRDDHLTLERNPAYILAEAPFERVVFRVIPEASTRAAELIAGSVDLINNVAPDQESAINNSGTATVQAVSGTRRIYVGFNFAPGFASTPGGAPLQNKAVRQALEYAVDVPQICASLLQFPCQRMSSPIEPQHTNILPYPYEPDKAEAMLDAAGYTRGQDGVRFHVTLQGPKNRYLEDEHVAQAVGQYLSDIGVQTEVQTMDFNSVFAPRARQHQVGPLFLMGNGGAMWSPFFEMSLFPTRMANTNTGEWQNARWDQGLENLRSIRDPAKERAELHAMEEAFRDDAPWLFLYFQPDFYASSARIKFSPRRDELIDVMSMQPVQ